jgi:hypothetical protein
MIINLKLDITTIPYLARNIIITTFQNTVIRSTSSNAIWTRMQNFGTQLPFRGPRSTTVSDFLFHLPFISCRILRFWLDTAERAYYHGSDFWVSLREGTGLWAGILNVHYHHKHSSTCELIGISRGYAKGMECWHTTPLPPREYRWREEIQRSTI